jgi:hypothetical protein
MPTTPPQTAQLARLVEESRAQDEQLAQGTRELRARWAAIHKDWNARAEVALESSAPDASQPPQPKGLPKLIAQMERLLDRVAAGEAALLGGDAAGGDEALRVRAVRLLNESLSYHIASAINPLQQAMSTGDPDLTAAARRALEGAQGRVDQALQEVPMVHAREVQAAHAEELGADRFIYLGPSDGRNRPFCADKVGKTFTREEIALLDNGQGLDVMTRCGGWGCRHHWRAMPLAYEALAQGIYEPHDDEFRRMMGLPVELELPEERFFTPDELKEIWSFDTRGWFQDEHAPRNIDRETITEEYVLEQARLGRQFLRDNARKHGVNLDSDEDAPRAAAFLRDFVLGVADIEEPTLSVKRVVVGDLLDGDREGIIERYKRDIALLGRGTTLHPNPPDDKEPKNWKMDGFVWGVHVDPTPKYYSDEYISFLNKNNSALLIEDYKKDYEYDIILSRYSPKSNLIFIVNDDRRHTSRRARLSHEIAHQIEHLNLNAALAGQRFRDRQLIIERNRLNSLIANDESEYNLDEMPLNAVLPQQDPDERGYLIFKGSKENPVEFAELFGLFVHDYSVKVNPPMQNGSGEYSTEVISVGMEYLDNPWSTLYFYRRSPTHLGFMIALMQGKFGFRENKVPEEIDED